MASNQRAESQRLWEEAKKYLIQMLQPGNPRGFAHGIKRSSLNHRSAFANVDQGLSFQSSRMPSDAEITAFAEQNPAYQAAVRREKRRGQQAQQAQQGPQDNQTLPVEPGNMPGGSSGFAAGPEGNLATQALSQAVNYQNQANAFNEARYSQLLGEQGALRDRRQERAANWGTAATADIDERLQDALSNAAANAADRGLANTNVVDAYRMRASRDSAREAQRVSEMRDSRMNEYDAQDTAGLLGFIERRTDQGPDMNQLMGLLQQYGAGGGGLPGGQVPGGAVAGAAGGPQGAAKAISGSGGGGGGQVPYALPAPRGAAMPMFVNGNPLQMANQFFAGRGPQVGVVSNRKPQRRPKGKSKSKLQASGGGITSNSHPVGLAANVAGLAYNAGPGLRQAIGSGVFNAGNAALGAQRAMSDYYDAQISPLEKTNPAFYRKNIKGARAVYGAIDDAILPLWDAGRYIAGINQ
jgi:hypothetical protein